MSATSRRSSSQWLSWHWCWVGSAASCARASTAAAKPNARDARHRGWRGGKPQALWVALDAFFRADKSFRDVIELFAVLAAQPLGGAFSAHGRLIGLAHGIHIVGDTKRSKRGLSD